MERLTPPELASMILSAPVWARLGIAVRDEQLRVRAAEEMARTILAGEGREEAADQLTLAL